MIGNIPFPVCYAAYACNTDGACQLLYQNSLVLAVPQLTATAAKADTPNSDLTKYV